MADEDIISLFKTNRYQVSPCLLKYYIERKGKRYDENVYRYLINRYSDSSSIEETLYRICKGIETHPKCPICYKPIPFNKKNSDLFNICCCQQCTNVYLNKIGKLNNKSSIEKAKKTRRHTLKEKYGVENSYQLEKSKLKIKETCLSKYGVDHPMKNEAIKAKVKESIKKSCKEKYKVDNPLSSKEIRQKIEDTNIRKYGVKAPLQNKIIHTKAVNQAKEVFKNKYGVDNPWKVKAIRTRAMENSKESCISKYDVSYPLQNKDILNKAISHSKETCFERYKTNTPLESKLVHGRIQQTNLKKYGVKYPFESAFIKQKITDSNLKKYGVKYPIQCLELYNKIQEKSKETCLKKYGVDNQMKNPIILQKVYDTKRKNHSFNTSKPEEILYRKLIDKYGVDDVIRQYKSDVYPFACDFYIKSKDLYIELQGMWTHGGHPFDSNSKEDLLKLNIWKEKAKTSKFYKNAINVWTISDINKRNIAKQNNLNYKEIWKLDE